MVDETPSRHTLPSVVIAVLTYKRPADIVIALSALAAQVGRVPEQVRILVVDNDPAASARPVLDDWAGEGVHYVHESRPGIAAARNRALDESIGIPVLIFFDDDETPSESWLEQMLATLRESGATGVVGPVVSEYAVELDDWMRGGKFFDRRRMPTGTIVEAAATNNLLLDLDWLRAKDIRFDEAYGLSGGSDTLFTRQITLAGGRLIWCDEAIVLDRVPAERLTRKWVLQRAFRSGNSWSRTGIELSQGFERLRRRAQLSGSGLTRIGGGALQVSLGIVLASVAHRARGTRTIMRGAGLLVGAYGHVYSEYKRDRDPNTKQ